MKKEGNELEEPVAKLRDGTIERKAGGLALRE